jgi:hypothetical protein
MGHEVLVALADPAQVTDAQLVCLGERNREDEPSGVSERPGSSRDPVCRISRESVTAQLLRTGQVQTKEVALVRHSVSH